MTIGEVKLVLHELAAFHATSHHFIKTYPGGLTSLAAECPCIFEVGKPFFEVKDGSEEMLNQILQMTQKKFDSSLWVVKKFGSEEQAKKMEAFQSSVSDVMKELLTQKITSDVVTHGDAWYSNFLFK